MRTISKKAIILLAVLGMALAFVGVRAIDEYLDRTAWERAADVVYPMTNQGIEWTYAGKGGAGK